MTLRESANDAAPAPLRLRVQSLLAEGRWRLRRLARRARVLVHLASKLARLTPREWRYLVLAQVELIRSARLVRRERVGHLVDPIGTREPLPQLEGEGATGEEALAIDLAKAVARAAAFGLTRPLCLVRAVALNRMLERRGIRGSRIRIGVLMNARGFAAHAWVEYRGRTLADHEDHVSKFTELTDVRLAGRSA